MKRYWIKFDLTIDDDPPIGVLLGCGVTAEDLQEALLIIREKVFLNEELPKVVEFIEDVDVSTLDERHVMPNVGNIFIKGIWFPKGYE